MCGVVEDVKNVSLGTIHLVTQFYFKSGSRTHLQGCKYIWDLFFGMDLEGVY